MNKVKGERGVKEEGLQACGGLECKHRKGVLYICVLMYRVGVRRPLNAGRGQGVNGGVKVQEVDQHSLMSAGRGQGGVSISVRLLTSMQLTQLSL